MIIHPYTKGSGSVHNLKDYIRGKGVGFFLKYDAPQRPEKAQVINWGSKPPQYDYRRCKTFLNHPDITKVFTNKLLFFTEVHGAGGDKYTPEWSIYPNTEWDCTVERHSLSGTCGAGIRIVEKGGEFHKAPLYVKYEKKTDEYRLHVVRDKPGFASVLHHQKKVAPNKENVKDWKIRNHENGFIFQQNGYFIPEAVMSAALGIVNDCFPGIDFVALDITYHKPTNKAYVLEGNTAPGLEGTSVQKYGDYFIERFS